MTEADEQKKLVGFLKLNGLLFASVPNENGMSYLNKTTAAIQGAKLKAMGKSKGCPDMFIFLHGVVVAIEMKRALKKGRSKPVASAEQKAWIKALNELGHPAKICYGFDEAKDFLILHL